MDDAALRTEVRRLAQQARRVEQILPTLATKDELRAEIAESRRHAEGLAAENRQHAEALAADGRAYTEQLVDQVRQHAEGLAAENRRHAEALAAENRVYTDERTRRLEVLIESLRDDVRLIAEAQVVGFQRQERMWRDARRLILGHERRITRLEARMPPEAGA